MRLKLPSGSSKAYLFDCDGTIADLMPLHYVAWSKALSEWNCEFREELFYAWGGMPVAEIISALQRKARAEYAGAECGQTERQLYLEILPQLKAVSEVLEHIEARDSQIPFAVVSESTRDSVTSLETPKILDRFDTLVCAGDCERVNPIRSHF
jgi:beta-phosphoglucomutase-like phosphatase (HAD superfamily)